MEPSPGFEDCIENGKNKCSVSCQFCPSKMLIPSAASYVTIEHTLPLMTQKKEEVTVENGERLKDFWLVDDMFTFENIGFTHTVDDIKYLSCADCERGPVGYHLLSTKKSYLALARVKNHD